MIRPFIVGLVGALAIAGSLVIAQPEPTGSGAQVRAETSYAQDVLSTTGQSLEGIKPAVDAMTTRWYALQTLKKALAERAEQRSLRSSSHSDVQPSGTQSSGSFPGDCIANHESAHAGLYTAYNPDPADNGNASGKYQVTSGTWHGYGGYSEARYAPPAVQEAQAHDLWSRNPRAWNGTGCPGTG